MLKYKKENPDLDSQSYKLRRIIDALKLIPVLGLFFWMLPLLWNESHSLTISFVLIYIFIWWILLIIFNFWANSKLSSSALYSRSNST
tara:strand:+ start:1338 stop:1601 length:264 start_codon:yes stop_codon:yes gene_type:complete